MKHAVIFQRKYAEHLAFLINFAPPTIHTFVYRQVKNTEDPSEKTDLTILLVHPQLSERE